MTDEPQDYFKSAEHEQRVDFAIKRETERLKTVFEKDGVFPSVSDAIGSLSTYTSWFSSVGLERVAIDLLEAEAKRLRKKTKEAKHG